MRSKDPLLFTEHSTRFEILPIVFVGILLNVAGRFVAAQAGITFIWCDCTGTIFVSLLLGPWWGATTGLLGNALIGQFEVTFLKYGMLTIVRALAWGYVGHSLWFRKRLLEPRDEAHPFRVARGLLLAAAALGVFDSLVSASIKTALFVLTDGAQTNYMPELAPLYSFPAPPSPDARFQSWLAFLVGDGSRQVVQSLVTGWIAMALVRHALLLSHVPRLQAPQHPRLVSRGAVTVFLLVDLGYQSVLWMASRDDAVLRDDRIRTFLISQLVSPMFFGLLVLSFGVYTHADGTLAAMRRWKFNRERHYRAVATLRASQERNLAEGKGLRLSEAHAVVAVVVQLLAWRSGAFVGGKLGKSDVINSLIYLLLFVALGWYYFARRREFGQRFAVALVSILNLRTRRGDPRARAERLETIGSLIAYAARRGDVRPQHQVLRQEPHRSLLLVGAWLPERAASPHLVADLMCVVVNEGGSGPGQPSPATGLEGCGVADSRALVLVDLHELSPDAPAPPAPRPEAFVGQAAPLARLGRRDLIEIARRRVVGLQAWSVLERGWLRARAAPPSAGA